VHVAQKYEVPCLQPTRFDAKVIGVERLKSGSYTASLFNGEDKGGTWTDDEGTGARCAILDGRSFAGIGKGV
jgi:hypothetical protein